VNDMRIKDLDFIYQQLRDNHPAFYNDQDAEFRIVLQQGYDEARVKVSELYWWQNHITLLQEYMKSFHDTHLRIYTQDLSATVYTNKDDRKIYIEYLQEDSALIYIPTFMPNEEQEKQFENMIQEVSQLKSMKKIIFDLRGNSGGNSYLGTQLLKSLFGNDYVEQQLYELYKDESVWWRASKDNYSYLYELIEKFSKNKELHKDVLVWLTGVAQGVKQSLQEGEMFFVEKETNYKKSLHKIPSPIQAKIIVVIDRSNVSAALDFITELKVLSNDIIFIGHKTDADTIYMEVRTVFLPSKYGILQFPIKMYHNRPRLHNQNYNPDIICESKNINDAWILDTVNREILKDFIK
tara:strand:+ start:92 stop:1144 length:1053 start_codon:yes stop_codon:yes gene_type:complete